MKQNLNNTEYESLIIRYLHGEANDKEKILLLEWLKESVQHVQIFNQIRLVAEEIISNKEEFSFDIEKALGRFEKQLDSSVKPSKIAFFHSMNTRRIWLAISSVAAAVILAVFFGGIFQQKDTLILAATTSQQLEIMLEDGTTAVLSPYSKIESSENFGKTHRRITLKGEVFFNVEHDSEVPLVIEINKVIITDIGTAFNVRVDSVSGNVHVQVKEGIVKIDADKNTETLYAGDSAVVNVGLKNITTAKISSKENTKKEVSSKLIFKDTPLDDVVLALNQIFNVKFVIKSQELHALRFNATIEENITLDQIRELLCLALNIKIVSENGNLLMYSLNEK